MCYLNCTRSPRAFKAKLSKYMNENLKFSPDEIQTLTNDNEQKNKKSFQHIKMVEIMSKIGYILS